MFEKSTRGRVGLCMATIGASLVLIGCQTQRGVYLRTQGADSVALDASSAALPKGAADYLIEPTDELVVDVHRGADTPTRADFGDSVFADFSLHGAPYHLAPGDSLGLSLQFESDKDFELHVQPDGHVVLPRIGVNLPVDGRTLDEVTRMAMAQYAKVMTRPDITFNLLKSSGERVEKLSGKYEVSRDGQIVVPTLGAMDVLGRSSPEIARMLQEKAIARYRNPIAVSATIAEFTATDTSILPTADTRRYFRDTVKVSPDGGIYLPFAGRLDAAGRSLSELTAMLTTALQRRYQNKIDVNVALGASSGMNVYVAGEVRAPGRQAYQARSTMLQVLASAGWVSESGDLTRVNLIHRDAPGHYLVYTANLQQVYQEANAGFQDLPLSPQDMVVVPRSDIANANQVVEMYIRRMLPFGTAVSYTYVTGKSTTLP